MSSDWPVVKLDDIAIKINTGLDAIRRAPIVEYETDKRCLRIQDISQSKPFESWGYTEVKDIDFEKFQLVPGDIIMARTCSTGINYLVKKPLNAVFNNGLARIRLDTSRALPKYLYYVFQSKQFTNYISGISGGTSVQLNMKIGDLAKYEFLLPSIEAQRLIADRLARLDDKIELNRQINQTLEQIAQTIFKSWFVDFEPVKAKIEAKQNGQDAERAAMRAISGKTDEQLDQLNPEQRQQITTTAALFPDELEDSELGELPKGWSYGSLNNLCELNANSWTKKNKPDEVWYVDLANTKNGVVEEIQHFTWKDSPSRARRIVKPGDTIVGTVRPGNRSFALIGKGDKQLTASTGFAVLTPNKKEYLEYIYIAATSDLNIERLAHLADGAAYPAVRPDVVTQMGIVIPNKAAFQTYSEITRSIFLSIDNSLQQEEILASCRDTLLPKLLSGEITLSSAQSTSEIVA